MAKHSRQQAATAKWLIENGGPVIRYRTATGMPAVTGADTRNLEDELLNDITVRKWLDNLQSYEFMAEQRRLGKGLGEGGHSSFLHGSKSMNFEVVLPKLAQLGLHSGMPVLDGKTLSWLRFLDYASQLHHDTDYSDDAMFHKKVYSFHDAQLVVASSLALAGYVNNEPVQRVIKSRLNVIYEAVKEGVYDICEKPGTVSISPKKLTDRVLKRELYPDGNIRLPFALDICGFTSVYAIADQESKNKIGTIIKWMLAPEYQRLYPNYGFVRYPSGRGKHVDNKVDFPGYFGFDSSDFKPRSLILRCWLMAHFPEARAHTWFQAALSHLEGFITESGTYLFPEAYLEEVKDKGKSSYGGRMGLGEDRRNPKWRELESTFWTLAIQQLADGEG